MVHKAVLFKLSFLVFEMFKYKQFKLYSFTLIAIGSLQACGPSPDMVQEAYNLPEKPTHIAEELFSVDEPIDGTYFKAIYEVHSLSDGNFVVQDYPGKQLFEFDSNGNFIQSIGREGRGPGEFLGIDISFVTENDSLHVYQKNFGKHQVFHKNLSGEWDQARERTYINTLSSFSTVKIPTYGIYKISDEEWIGIFRVHPSSRDTLESQYSFIARLDHNLERSGDTSRVQHVSDLAIKRRDDGMSVRNSIFFSKTAYLYHPNSNSVILVSNSSNVITAIDPNGNRTIIGKLPYEKRYIDKDDVTQSLIGNVELLKSMNNEVYNKLMDVHPYYLQAFLNDDELWIELNRLDSTKPNWIVTNFEGEIQKSLILPDSFYEIHKIVDNKIYGVAKDSLNSSYFTAFELISLN